MKRGHVVLLLSGVLLLVVTSARDRPSAPVSPWHEASGRVPPNPCDANPPASGDLEQQPTRGAGQAAEVARVEGAPPRAQGGAILSEVLAMLLWQRLDPQEDVIDFVPRTLGRTLPSAGQAYWDDGFRCWDLGVDIEQLTVAIGVGAVGGEQAYRLMVKLQGVSFPRPFEAALARIRIETQRIQSRTVVRAMVTNQMKPSKKTVDFLVHSPSPEMEFGHQLTIDDTGEVLKTTYTARSLGIDGLAQRYPIWEYPRDLLEESALSVVDFAAPNEPVRERSIPDGLADQVYESLQDAVNKVSARD